MLTEDKVSRSCICNEIEAMYAASLYNDNHKMRNNYMLVGSSVSFDEKSILQTGECLRYIYARMQMLNNSR